MKKKSKNPADKIYAKIPNVYKFLIDHDVDTHIADECQQLINSFVVEHTYYLNLDYHFKKHVGRMKTKLCRTSDYLLKLSDEIDDSSTECEDPTR